MSEVSREEMREMRDTGRRAMEKVADVARQAAAQSGISRTFARVSKVNGDGTLQLELGSEAHPMPLYAVRSTTACAAAQPGDTVVVDTYAHVPLATGIVHTAGSAAHLVPPHDASAITSGTIDPARVPIGDGLTVSDGAIAVDNGAYVNNGPAASALFWSSGDSVADLDEANLGVCHYDVSTDHRPNDYGCCLTMRCGDGRQGANWVFQLALPTVGDPKRRRNINGSGWTSWWTWATS